MQGLGSTDSATARRCRAREREGEREGEREKPLAIESSSRDRHRKGQTKYGDCYKEAEGQRDVYGHTWTDSSTVINPDRHAQIDQLDIDTPTHRSTYLEITMPNARPPKIRAAPAVAGFKACVQLTGQNFQQNAQ